MVRPAPPSPGIWRMPVLTQSHRGGARVSTRQVGRCTNEAPTQSGRWTARRKRCGWKNHYGAVIFSYAGRAAILPEPVVIREVVYRYQDVVLRLR